MPKPISNGPIAPASPAKQLILRLAGELARLHDSQPSTLDLIAEARAYLAQPEPVPVSADAAFAIGQTGGPPSEVERLAFEAWMRGHSWLVSGKWNGTTYADPQERYSSVDLPAMQTRMLWAAWRDRAALARWSRPAQPEPEGPTDEEIMRLMPQQMHEDLAAAARALAEQASTISTSATGIMRIMLNRHAVDLARTVLARWGK